MTNYDAMYKQDYMDLKLKEIREFVFDIIKSSDRYTIINFWVPFAVKNISVGGGYFFVIFDVVEKIRQNDLNEYEEMKIKNMLLFHWKQIYNMGGISGFFKFLDVLSIKETDVLPIKEVAIIPIREIDVLSIKEIDVLSIKVQEN